MISKVAATIIKAINITPKIIINFSGGGIMSEFVVLQKFLDVDLLRGFYGRYINSSAFKSDSIPLPLFFENCFKSFFLLIGKQCFDYLELHKHIKMFSINVVYEVYSSSRTPDELIAIYSICRTIERAKKPPQKLINATYEAINEDINDIISTRAQKNVCKVLSMKPPITKLFLSLIISMERKPSKTSTSYCEKLFDIVSLISNDIFNNKNIEELQKGIVEFYKIFNTM